MNVYALDAVAAGPLLGAGSFARVFKAKWAGLDVAVKVSHWHRVVLAMLDPAASLQYTLAGHIVAVVLLAEASHVKRQLF
jgi:hypothetical protein